MEENTHHCYLLQSLSSPSKTYIGYTVNPHRRIKQHNGIIKGGANYTSKFRPWKFICITEGFESEQQGLKFEWAWQNPKRSRIFRSGLGGGGTGSSMALAGSLQKMGGPLGKLRLLMILLCESQDFQKERLNLYFFEQDFKLDFEDLLRYHSENGGDCGEEEEDGGDGENVEEVVEKMIFPRQMKIHLIDGVEEMPFFRKSYSQQRQKDLMLNNVDSSWKDEFSDGGDNNETFGIRSNNDNCGDVEVFLGEDDSMIHDDGGGPLTDSKTNAIHCMIGTGTTHEIDEDSCSSDESSPNNFSETCLEHSISSLSIHKHEDTIIKSTWRQKYSQAETSCNKTEYNSLFGVIDLLDSSDDDHEGDVGEKCNTSISRDMSVESSFERERMDVCSPMRDEKTSTMPVIDLTGTSPASRHIHFGDNLEESSQIIDLCSPMHRRV